MVTFSGGLFCLVFALIRGNAEGWGSATIVALLLAGRALLIAFVVVERGAGADARPLAVPQAGLHGRPDRGLLDLGVDVLDVPLPHALHAERAEVLAVPAGLRFLPVSVLSFFAAPLAAGS